MRLRRRGLILLLAVTGTIPVGALASALAPLPFALLILLIGICIADGTLGVASGGLALQRQVDARIAVGARVPVGLRITHRGPRSLQLRVIDGAPNGLRPENAVGDLAIPDGSSIETTYHLNPDRRGRYRFEGCWLVVRGRLGLVDRTLYRALPGEVVVVPDLRPVRAYDLLARRATTRTAGIRPVRLPGEGTEVEQLREYVSGDAWRNIDWKATARHLRPITRDTEAERRRSVVFVIDAGRAMSRPSGRLLKLDHAINCALFASHVALRNGDLSGTLAFSDRVLGFLPPGRGSAHRARLLDTLSQLPVSYAAPDYEAGFRLLAERVGKRCLCILLTDLSDPGDLESLVASVSVVARRHLLLVVHLIDPEVEALVGRPAPDLRTVNRRAVAERLHWERRSILDRIRAAGGHVLECPADRLDARVVNRYFELKGRSLV